MTTPVRRAVPAVPTAVVLLASTACWHEEADFRPDPRVWVVDVVPDKSFAAGQRATLVGDRHEVTLQFTVFATVCAPQAFEDPIGGGYGHINCLINPIPGTVNEIDHAYPDLRVRELTATAHVQIVAEHGTQPVKTLVDREVGPLTMGVPEVHEPVSWPFDPSFVPSDIGDPTNPYRLYAIVRDCRLSNGSACGNNSRRYFFAPPDGIGTGQQGLDAAGAELTIPGRAGGLAKLEMGSGQEGRPNQPDPNRPIGGVPVRRIVQGLFQAGSGLGRVHFWGAEFAEPRPPQAVDRSGAATVEQAFSRGLTVGVNSVPISELRRYDAGPLGGTVWCRTFRHTVLTTQASYGCGWVDQWTVGTVSVNSDARENLGLTEAEAAALLVSMRADIETVR